MILPTSQELHTGSGGATAPDQPTTPASQEPHPYRVQRSRAKGWRLPPNTVVVSRPSKWGNPFDFRRSEHCWTALAYGCKGDAIGRQEASVRAYREWVSPQPGYRTREYSREVFFGTAEQRFAVSPRVEAGLSPSLAEIRTALAGKNLACWCALDAPCHADVLLELANEALSGDPLVTTISTKSTV